MFEVLAGSDTMVDLALIALWALAAWRLGGLARQPDARKRASGAKWVRALLVVAAVPVVAKAVLIALLLFHGWEFGANDLVFGVPMVLVPAVFAYVWTFPALRNPDNPALYADLKVGLPPRLTAIGGAFAFWLGFFKQPVGGLFDEVAIYGFLFLIAALLQVVKLRKVSGLLATGSPFPGLGARLLRTGAKVTAFVAVVVVGSVWGSSSSTLPGSYNMAEHGGVAHAAGGHSSDGISPVAYSPVPGKPITELTGPKDGVPDKKFTLTARTTEITLPSGAKIHGWTYDGSVPGPLLRVRQHELVEVELLNADVEAGVSLHWHGVDVPNAEDGVPGLTQDAVRPGGRHVYRFRAPDVGSYWYHSHQVSSEQVRAGLYGGFIVDPAEPEAPVTDIPVVVHTFKNQIQVMGGTDLLDRKAVAAGTKTRLRLINSDSQTRRFSLTGTPFKVTGIDGTPVNGPTEVTDNILVLGGGARYDVEFTMPDAPVRLATLGQPDSGMLLSPDGAGDRAPRFDGPELDANSYGTPAPTEFGADSPAARTVEWVMDNRLGFYDGRFAMVYTVNGDLFPNVPAVVVREGDLVRMRFVNRSFVDHPMHLHGHHALVLSRNGKPATGSPQWLDTVTVHPGETYEVMFKADNPGLWMDHCHDLDHAALGMVMHLSYEGYRTPFVAGYDTPNQPE
ncbi:Multicopper oxidase with three cupredoxin domains (includes cell division protein FtsP and spore coat protein CotA) [Actinokineospora alba]|uniref:Multicopper oxidase with three cupredoxin domains (Includes cell division protein FtsP and spore coat protein CotA) n=1 Tax=Actinokineospora alba TaxID=504798 RepID=A0A1H0W3K1_9PSEU|nr:multicopper oxidase family protein [Actinokineospora alba]TDP67838.1 FtsP/CotA-like multicopper oxidase with cupredoxin domain [Actinokineospora alba]SDI72716.1 Multicopper oxidase with three cupredoxin domains (includes cell division protein FtsP and spore coat protein CotA) [Actinokineospora alba]SDP85307.1 Multicopper oxidase with three cupredoxin domains (includes cell division protein FtsP and spore coat protein CotA) [Actinokineospora alba]